MDSGDLVALSNACKMAFENVVSDEPSRTRAFGDLTIVASNDINEEVLEEFSKTDHSLTAFGIGTNLVTCQAQPALGCVYKLVECNGEPRIKLSEEIVKVTLPGRKRIFRFFGGEDGNEALLDYMMLEEEKPPIACADDEKSTGILCRHPFHQQHRIRVFPRKVKALQSLVFDSGRVIEQPEKSDYLSKARNHLSRQLSDEFSDHITSYRGSPNESRYDVMVSPKLYDYLHELWEKNAPVPVMR